MTVNKRNGFAAPYRSATLQGEASALIGRNGLLSMSGVVSESGGNILIPPFIAIQNGLIIEKTNVTSVVKSLTLAPPYYVVVSAVTSVNVDDLVFQFARSPLDVSANETILAEYDGTEWRPHLLISADGILNDHSLEVVQRKQVGPYSGLLTSISGGNYLNSKGLLYDNRGDRALLTQDLLIPIIGSDVEPTWRRVDRIVYRRASDSINRIGVRKLLIGGSYAPSGPQVLNSVAAAIASNIKTVIASDNTAHIFHTSGFGNNFAINYKKLSSDRATTITTALIVSNVTSDQYSITIDSADHIHLVYTQANDIKLLVINNIGTTLYGPIAVSGLAHPCSNPKIETDANSTKLFITFEYLEGPSNRQIYLCTRSLTGALITPSVKITHTSTDIMNPDMDISSDLVVHLAYEDAGVIKYIALDDIGQVVAVEQTISANTGSTSFGTLVNQATNACVEVTDNQEVTVAFRQKKGSSYGVTVWKAGYAFMQNLVAMGENITAFDCVADSFDGDLHLTLAQAGSVNYVLLKNWVVALTVNLQLTGAQNVYVVKDKLGSLFHNWTDISPGTYTNSGTPQGIDHVGPIAVAGILSPLILLTNQFSCLASVSPVPQVGMEVLISGSTLGNNGEKVISAVSLQSINTANDTYVVTVTTNFASTEITLLGQYQTPDGAMVHHIKSVANSNETRALSMATPSSDTLLSRISWPGPVVLNYIPVLSTPGVNSDLFGMYGDIDVDWGATSSGALTMTTGLNVIDLVSTTMYTVSAGSFPLAEGSALYIVLDGIHTSIVPQAASISSLPWALPIQVLGFRENNEFHPHLFSVAGMNQLTVGEQVVLGQDLSKSARIRLGITSETSMAAYTSTAIIAPTDPYPTSISKLDQAVGLFGTQVAQEEDFVVGVGGQSVFTVSTMTFNANNTFLDIAVYLNGRKVKQDVTGGVLQDFKKTSTTSIQFNNPVLQYGVVTIRQERTGAPPVGGGVDLTNIGVDPQPITNASNSLGAVTKGWKSLFLKDTLSSQVYEIKIIGGVLQAVTVP